MASIKNVKLIFIGVQLLYNFVLVSVVRRNESAVHLLPFGLPSYS